MMERVYKRTSLVVSTIRRLCHGRQRLGYLDKEWSLTISSDDLKSKQELTLEAKLHKSVVKNDKLEEQMEALNDSNKTEKRKVASLSELVRKAQSQGYQTTRGCSRIKSPSKCTDRHRRALKRKRAAKCTDALAWLESEGYSATKVVLRSEKTGKVQAIDLDKEGFLGPGEDSGTLEEELDTINMMLYVKDRFNVSGGAYHEMAQLVRDMPRHYKLKDRIAELNKLWNIRSTPEGTSGVQQSIEERLRYCLERLVCIILNTIHYMCTWRSWCELNL